MSRLMGQSQDYCSPFPLCIWKLGKRQDYLALPSPPSGDQRSGIGKMGQSEDYHCVPFPDCMRTCQPWPKCIGK